MWKLECVVLEEPEPYHNEPDDTFIANSPCANVEGEDEPVPFFI